MKIRFCAGCGRSRWSDAVGCRDCGGDSFEVRDVNSNGHVVALTETPNGCFAVVEVLDGIRALATVPPGMALSIGSAVALEAERGLFSVIAPAGVQ